MYRPKTTTSPVIYSHLYSTTTPTSTYSITPYPPSPPDPQIFPTFPTTRIMPSIFPPTHTASPVLPDSSLTDTATSARAAAPLPPSPLPPPPLPPPSLIELSLTSSLHLGPEVEVPDIPSPATSKLPLTSSVTAVIVSATSALAPDTVTSACATDPLQPWPPPLPPPPLPPPSLIELPSTSSLHLGPEVEVPDVTSPATSKPPSTSSAAAVVSATSAPPPVPPKYMEIVNKLTMEDAQEAGSFLDGCKVYLSGLSPDVCDNLSSILHAVGATRLSALSDSVSHIIVGDHIPEDVNYRKSSGVRPHVVTIDWLLESMKQRHPASESLFLVFVMPTKPPPPLKRKSLPKNKRQLEQKSGGIKLPQKRKAEEIKRRDGTGASIPARPDALHISSVAGTSRGSVQHGGSSQTEVKRPPKIMLSFMNDKVSYFKKIISLGGLVSERPGYDHSATHLVCARPGRCGNIVCHKLICSIASGKWVLHESFIDASWEAGTFVKEEPYEYGNPLGERLWGQLTAKMDLAWAMAVYRWRCKVSASNCGAFSFMRAIICANQRIEDALTIVIKAGGGQVLDIRPPFKNPQGATHCLAKLNDINEPIDMEALVKNKVPCVHPGYIHAYLILVPPPSVRRWILPEYKRVKEQLARS